MLPHINASTSIDEQPPVSAARLQRRDPKWADATEGDIHATLGKIPYIATSSGIQIVCGANICEASGQLATDISEYHRDIARKYLNSDKFTDDLGDANAMIDSVTLDSQTGQFTVQFSRLRK